MQSDRIGSGPMQGRSSSGRTGLAQWPRDEAVVGLVLHASIRGARSTSKGLGRDAWFEPGWTKVGVALDVPASVDLAASRSA